MKVHALNSELMEKISAFTGIRFHDSDAERLQTVLTERERATHQRGAENYVNALVQNDANDLAERHALASALIPLESFFFRDAGQVALIRNRLLPQCIAQRAEGHLLRIWSAGCSTGEEAYTLAMLVSELLPPAAAWNVTVLATDINQQALQRARAGLYSHWSFRGVPEQVRHRYFTCENGCWKIAQRIRDMVRFVEDDLLSVSAPAVADGDFDLIVCRNVLMYYRDDVLPAVVDKLTQALAPKGFLLVGHNELSTNCYPSLSRQSFPESAVYSRVQASGVKPQAEPLKPTLRVSINVGRTTNRVASKPVASTVTGQKEELLQAWQFADAGLLEQAKSICERLIACSPLEAGPYYLQAHLAQEKGDWQRAHALLKQVIYLDPGFVMAYFDMSALCTLDGDVSNALRLQQVATDLLEKLPSDAALPPRAINTAGELLTALKGQKISSISYA